MLMTKKQKCQLCGGNKKSILWFGHKKDEQFCSPNCQAMSMKIIFSKEIAESVLGTFELIIKTVEETENYDGLGRKINFSENSITVDQLKALKKVMQKKYYNKKVILQ